MISHERTVQAIGIATGFGSGVRRGRGCREVAWDIGHKKTKRGKATRDIKTSLLAILPHLRSLEVPPANDSIAAAASVAAAAAAHKVN